ncbi:hypothetical protein ACS0TY_025052 [Phlomoides rotata]
MAISSSTFPKKINRYKLSTLSVLLVFIFCIFLFNKRALDRKLFQNTDPIPQTPASILLSPPRSTKFLEKLGDLRDPVASLSNVASSSELSEPESQEEGKEEHVSSESDFDDKTTRENNVPFVSTDSESGDKLGDRNGEPKSPNEEKVSSLLSEPEFQEKSKEERVSLTTNLDEKTTQDIEKPNIASDPESQDNLGERNGEPMSSNEEKVVPISSESDTNDKTREKSEYIGVKEKSQDDFGERTDDPTSSNEETSVPISSNSDVDDNTEEKSEDIGLEETPSSDAEIGGVIDNAFVEKLRNCDIYKGTWVKDDDYPLYKPGSCPYVDDGFSCQSNGRPDSGYTQWRWKPDECDLPRFNATDFLVRLRGKRLMLVGDSMNRNQFESLLCLLREGLADKSRMYETHGYKISKGRGYFIFKFKDYGCSVEFVRSHFLVREGVRINGQGNSNPTLSIDRIDKTANRWLRADILVFNTGHWWTHGKTARGKNYYKEGDHIYPRFDAAEAYRRAITTWATWVKKNMQRKKLVIYRGYSSAHFRYHFPYSPCLISSSDQEKHITKKIEYVSYTACM